MLQVKDIVDDCSISIKHYHPVQGGDINKAYCLYGQAEKYFLKINNAAAYPGMFRHEAKGLEALRQSCTLAIPAVIKYGTVGNMQYLLLQWIESGKPDNSFWEDFGKGLAMLHQPKQSFFGWDEDNYIGSLKQLNSKHESWQGFYTECRIMPLVKQLFDAGAFNKEDVEKAAMLCNKLDKLFPEEPPALLHGDLWSGNFMIAENGSACVYDPAVYYGHREMDIGMSKLFGGFDLKFYNAYNEQYPLEKGWQQRLELTQLYPLLVHAVLFGGHYVFSAKSVIEKF